MIFSITNKPYTNWVFGFLFILFTIAYTNSAIAQSCQNPVQATQSASYSKIQKNSVNLTMSRGNGQRCLIIAREGAPVNKTASQNQSYSANASFGDGENLGDGNFIVYTGTKSKLYISNLQPSTQYYFRFYEYNVSGNDYCYIDTYLDYNITTPCEAPSTDASNGSVSNISTTTADLNWTSGSGSNRLVIIRPESARSQDPNDDQTYTANNTYGNGDAIGDGYVVYSGNGNSVTISNLNSSTAYRAEVFEYNSGGNSTVCYAYNEYSFTFETSCQNPTIGVTNPNGVNFQSGGGSIEYTRGNGAKVLVIAREGSPVNATPDPSATYTANTTFGNGSEIGSGNFVLYNSTSNSFYMRGLKESTIYYLSFYEYEESTTGNCFSTETTLSVATKCAHPNTKSSAGVTTALTSSAATLSWTQGNGDNQLVIVRPSNTSLTSPEQYQYYTPNTIYGNGDALGDGFSVFSNSSTSVRVTGLEHSTEYTVDIFDYNASGEFECYNYSGGYSFNFTTLDPTLYVWNKTSGSHSYTESTNWTPNRVNPLSVDTLIFNAGGTSTITNVTTQSISHFWVKDQTQITLQSGAPTVLTLVNNGGFIVEAGSQVNFAGSNKIHLDLSTGTSSQISGTLKFTETGEHCITGAATSCISFENGADFICGATYDGDPFGNAPSNRNSVVFKSGAEFIMQSTNNISPFGENAPNAIANFQTGSRYCHETNTPIDIAGRTYGTFVYENNAYSSFLSGNQEFSIDTLIVKDGSFAFKGNHNVNITGAIEISGGDSIVFDPSTNQNITFSGTLSKMNNQDGTIRLGKKARLVINNGNNVTLSGNIILEGDLQNDGGNLTISASDSLSIDGAIDNSGNIYLEDDASLIQTQTSTLTNSGTVYVSRKIPDNAGAANYFYWGTPVTGGPGATVGAGGVLNGRLDYKYRSGAETGGYQWVGNGEQMEVGRGYAVETSPSEITFYGTPNNGTIDINIEEIDGENSYSLISNPYPSAINAQAFMDENDASLEGTIYLWSFNTNDNSGTKQYISVNEMGSNSIINPNQNLSTTNIASCQGFFVEANESLATGTATVRFKNSMRNGKNGDFKSKSAADISEKNWLYVKNENNDITAALYAITEDATNKFDNKMDAEALSSKFRISFETSAAEQSILAIPPVKRTTQIPLTIKVPTTGMHEIGMKQIIYDYSSDFRPILFDALTGITTELESESYNTSLEAGLITDRFFLLFGKNNTTTDIVETNKVEANLVKKGNYQYAIELEGNTPVRMDVFSMSGKKVITTSFSQSTLLDLTPFNSTTFIIHLVDNFGNSTTFKVLN